MAQPRQQPPPPETRAAATVAALTGAGTAGATAVAGGAALVGVVGLSAGVLRRLTRLWLSWGYTRATVRHGIRVTTRVLVTRSVPAAAGEAARATAAAEHAFVGWFLDASTTRYEAAVAAGVDPDNAAERERRYVDQHLDAQARRRDAAAKVDREAAKPGHVTVDPPADGGRPRVVLTWRAHTDDRVTPECAAADGAWFYADTPPRIGFPGMPHGGTCRCWPTPATSAAAVAAGRSVDEATARLLDHRPHPSADPGDTNERRTA